MHVANSNIHKLAMQRESAKAKAVMIASPSDISADIQQPVTTAKITTSSSARHSAVLKSEGSVATRNCYVCDREFKDPSALQAHLDNSKFHKKLARRQSAQPDPSLSPLLAVVPPPAKVADGSVLRGTDSFKHGNNLWSAVPDSQRAEVLAALEKHCHSLADLLENRYQLNALTSEDISDLRKCKKCGGMFSPIHHPAHSTSSK